MLSASVIAVPLVSDQGLHDSIAHGRIRWNSAL
jgi:hypothetical protein